MVLDHKFRTNTEILDIPQLTDCPISLVPAAHSGTQSNVSRLGYRKNSSLQKCRFVRKNGGRKSNG